MNRLVLVTRFDEYLNKIIENVKKSEKVCYVTFNKTSDNVALAFGIAGFKEKSLFFVDGITNSIKKTKNDKWHYYLEQSFGVKEILEGIKLAAAGGFSYVIVDTLSDLFFHNMGEKEANKLISGIKSLVNKDGKVLAVGYKMDSERIKSSGISAAFDSYERSFWSSEPPAE